ncbi:MAG: CRISPR-associated endonuclease Cas2 [Planctomycetes bacterium]|nr:CRISPR-associated endonuclease Cas2 [Planctomycetota bacterium]
MLVWAIYDIQSDRVRTRIAKVCKRAGLYRVQKSVFLGEIDKSSLDEMVLKTREEIDAEKDSMYLFPLCEKDFKSVVTVGRAFDSELVKDEAVARFF